MKKILFIALLVAVVIGGYLSFTTVDSNVPVANAGKTYNATMYVAGMGGHFAVADVTIDPSNTESPIKVNDLGMLSIGNKATHPTHDARIDNKDKNVMFWSTYKLDEGNLHVGKSDLKTGKVIQDVAFKNPDRATFTGANFCGSGQSDKSFIPVSMSNEGYLDVYDKATMKLKHRIWVSDLGEGCKPGEYTFAHGTNTPDMKAFLVTLNKTPDGHTKWSGNTELIMLDMAALENGHIKELARNSIMGGTPGKTITFRQYFSPDGKYLFQSGADRGYVIDAKTLKVLNEITAISGENHDIMPTPDAKYAVMTLREKIKSKEGEEITDGTIQLYDIENKKVIGKSTSVCYACHQNVGKKGGVLCGLDANWK